jgi:hypothetical protein
MRKKAYLRAKARMDEFKKSLNPLLYDIDKNNLFG